MHSIRIDIHKCGTDFSNRVYLDGFGMTSFILSLFVSKLVKHILLVANMQPSQIANLKTILKTFHSEIGIKAYFNIHDFPDYCAFTLSAL